MNINLTDEELTPLFIDMRYMPNEFVPIIGPELMVYRRADGTWSSIYDEIAAMVGEELGVAKDFSNHYTVEQAINAYCCKQKNYENKAPYRVIKEILANKRWEVPEPVKKLAEISYFKFYINATYLPFITDALVESGRSEKVEQRVNIIDGELEDFNDISDADHVVRVYHLFGNAREARYDRFGLTDDDILRLSHNLICKCPDNLDRFLKEPGRKLLLWGCNFSSWLTRLIFYSIRKDKAFSCYDQSIYFVGSRSCSNDPYLEPFWNRLNANICKTTETNEIVDIFYKKWKEEAKEAASSGKTFTGNDSQFPKNCVFISYDSADKKSAYLLYETLKRYNIPVWLDQEEIREGEYKYSIKYYIMNSSVFLPLISRHSIDNVTNNRTMYELEWQYAKEVSEIRLHSGKQAAFIIPVRIDDCDMHDKHLPDFITKYHGYDLDDSRLLKTVADAVMKFQTQ